MYLLLKDFDRHDVQYVIHLCHWDIDWYLKFDWIRLSFVSRLKDQIIDYKIYKLMHKLMLLPFYAIVLLTFPWYLPEKDLINGY